MLCREIIDIIERTYPRQAALEWDNVGLLAGRTDKDVRKIYVALDLTDEIIEDAVCAGADMIVTHHPLIFSPLKKITNENFIGNRVVKLIQHDISYYAMHTNYDVLGMAELSAEILGLQDADVLELTMPEEHEGIGRIGRFEEKMTVRACSELVKQRFRLPSVKVFGDMEQVVEKAAISPGSGKSMTGISIQKGAEVLITGDIDHHEGIDAVARNLVIIDAGHYGLEHIFIKDMADFLKTNLEGSEVVQADIVQPFQVI